MASGLRKNRGVVGSEELQVSSGYQVGLDPNSLEPCNSPEGPGYRLRLTGPTDSEWVRTYGKLWEGLSFFSNFHLDIDRHSVFFPYPWHTKDWDIGAMVQILEAMLRLTNLRASGREEEPEALLDSIDEEPELLTDAEAIPEADVFPSG